MLLGRWKGTLVAVKVLREECTQHANLAALADFRREAELLQSMRHPYILNFLGACFNCERVRTDWCIIALWFCIIACLHTKQSLLAHLTAWLAGAQVMVVSEVSPSSAILFAWRCQRETCQVIRNSRKM